MTSVTNNLIEGDEVFENLGGFDIQPGKMHIVYVATSALFYADLI
jgi:hypothetical protein